jgi:hypothetical protein
LKGGIFGKQVLVAIDRKVLKGLDLREKVVIGDALHTQKPVSIQIVESGGRVCLVREG